MYFLVYLGICNSKQQSIVGQNFSPNYIICTQIYEVLSGKPSKDYAQSFKITGVV